RLLVAGFAHLVRRGENLGRRIELRHQAVEARNVIELHAASFGRAPGSSVRISKIEIIGKKRMNRNMSDMKKPIVPTKVMTSKRVGEYMPQLDGRKSRCKLTTMMRNRSSHMPVLITSDKTNTSGMLCRTRFDQKNWLQATLQKMSANQQSR